MTVQIFTGDDIALRCATFKDQLRHPIDSGSTIQGHLKDKTGVVGPTVTIDESHADSDWANGVMIFEMDNTQTAALTPAGTNKKTVIEIEITDPTTGIQTVIFPHVGAIEIIQDTVS